jgi:hypothetical protein
MSALLSKATKLLHGSEVTQCAIDDRVHSDPRAEAGPSIIRHYLGYVRCVDRVQQASKDVIDLGLCRHAVSADFKQRCEAFVVQSDNE